MKYIIHILGSFLVLLTFFFSPALYAAENLDNIKTTGSADNKLLDTFRDSDDNFFNVGKGGAKETREFLFQIAKDVKNFFFIIATIYLLSLVYRLLFADKTEEEAGKFKSGIIWTFGGIMVMQLSYLFVSSLYGKQNINGGLANTFIEGMITPLIGFMQTAASFLFIGIAIYAFYQIVTANGDEEKVKKGKMSIAYGIIGYIVIKFSKVLVDSIYGSINCRGGKGLELHSCEVSGDLSGATGIIVQIIDWVNGFVGIIIVALIIYAGTQVLFSNGDEEKIKKAKGSILYIAIGIGILIASFLILTFFIGPNKII